MAKKDKKSKKNTKKMSLKGRLFMIASVLLGLAFLPTAMLLFIGMLPSIVAFFVADRKNGVRTSTVAAMNVAGCIPFILKLWSGENNFEYSLGIITDPQSISVMYVSAAFGYMIDWVVTGLVSSFLYQKGMARMKAIKKKQAFLVSHWGDEVSGKKEGGKASK